MIKKLLICVSLISFATFATDVETDNKVTRIYSMTKLRQLTGNDIDSDTALAEIANRFRGLNNLYLVESQLTGIIPPALRNLHNLQSLVLKNNELTGPIPASLGTLVHLHTLHLHNNHLTGDIPASLGNLRNLRRLDLSHNQLAGVIPNFFENLTLLNYLNLSHNQFTDTLPASLGDCPLMYIDVSHNELSGDIPASLGNLRNLRHLNLSHNHLTELPLNLLRAQGPLSDSCIDISYNQIECLNLDDDLPVLNQSIIIGIKSRNGFNLILLLKELLNNQLDLFNGGIDLDNGQIIPTRNVILHFSDEEDAFCSDLGNYYIHLRQNDSYFMRSFNGNPIEENEYTPSMIDFLNFIEQNQPLTCPKSARAAH